MSKKALRNQNKWLLIFVMPALLLFSVFVVVPFIRGTGYSFYDWDGISPDKTFVGLKNYIKLFHNKNFFTSVRFSVCFTVVSVITQNFGALILANLLDNVTRLKNFLRGIFFLPNVLSGVISAFIWSFIFTKILPVVGKTTFLKFLDFSWFSNGTTAFWATTIVSFWLGAGYLTIIYLAGLTTVDLNLLDAAKIDGANERQMLFRVKTPLIMPSVTTGIFLVTMNGLKQFDIVFLMTGGGPYKSTESLALLSYNTAYSRQNFGQATAQAMVLFAFVAIVTAAQLLVLKRKEVES